jgi:ER membrane protein complex subunit 3
MSSNSSPAPSYQATLLLDPAIRDWVLLPIMLVMVGVGILRHYVTLLLASTPSNTLLGVREACALNRCRTLRSICGGPGGEGRPPLALIPPAAIAARQAYLSHAVGQGHFLKVPVVEGQLPPNPMMDPAGMEAMMGMLKNNMMMIIPQTIIMSWITAFFSGFVISTCACLLVSSLLQSTHGSRAHGLTMQTKPSSPPAIPPHPALQGHAAARY